MLETHLAQLGLRDKEIAVFICLAEASQLTASKISEQTEIARSTVYTILESLIEKGFVSLVEEHSKTFYRLENPSSFIGRLEAEKEALSKKESTVHQLVEMLSSRFMNPDSGVPRIQFYSGKKNIEQMLFAQSDIWRQGIVDGDYTWWGYQDDTFVQQYSKWFEHIWATTAQDEKICLLSNKSAYEETLKNRNLKGRSIRQLPERFTFSSTVWVLRPYIVMITTHQKPHYAFQFRDAVFADNMTMVFKMLWEFAATLEDS
jgi:predicted transcriptional regulator